MLHANSRLSQRQRPIAPRGGPRVLPRVVALALCAAAALPSCSSWNEAEDTGVAAIQFQDMVVPEGFRLIDDAHQSHSRQEGDWRLGHFLYTGHPTIADAVAYVRQRMPQHNWQLELDDVKDAAQAKLRFARGRYVVDYAFLRQEGTTQMIVDYQTDYSRR